MAGASAWVNDVSWGPVANLLGIVGTLIVLYFWFGDAIKRIRRRPVQPAHRPLLSLVMSWFIFSEVMFFGAFFGALFYARTISMPWLADLDHKFIWPDFAPHWGMSARPARWKSSRPWGRSRSRPSTPRCC
jgi:cytochrome c oxidase subunit 3